MDTDRATADFMKLDRAIVLDRAVLQAVDLRETIFDIDDNDLKMMIDVLLFSLGRSAANCAQQSSFGKNLSDAA